MEVNLLRGQYVVKVIYDAVEKSKASYVRNVHAEQIKLYPTDLSKCPRALWYSFRIPATIETHALLKMGLGDATHTYVQDLLKDAQVLVAKEKRFTKKRKGYTINGRVDAIIKNEQGEKEVLELKSIYAQGFSRVEEEPDQAHVDQLYTYMIMNNIRVGRLVYIGRDNGRIVEYKIELCNATDKDMKQAKKELLAKFDNLYNIVKSETPPERPFKLYIKKTGAGDKDYVLEFTDKGVRKSTDWHCRYCSYANECVKEIVQKMQAGEVAEI